MRLIHIYIEYLRFAFIIYLVHLQIYRSLLLLLGDLLLGNALEAVSSSRLWFTLLMRTSVDKVVVDSTANTVLDLTIYLW